jgi:hypothetical protein
MSEQNPEEPKIELDTMFSGPAWVRVLTHPSGKLALFIEFAEDTEGELVADTPDDPQPVSSIILPHPVDEYAPADTEDELVPAGHVA